MLVSYGVCFLLSGSIAAAMFTSGSSTIGFAPLKCFIVYLWQPYVPPGAGLWLTSGVDWVAALSTALSRGSLILLSSPPAIQSVWWGIQIWGLGRVTISLCLPYMMERGCLFQTVFHLMRLPILNLWWMLNVVIPVW